MRKTIKSKSYRVSDDKRARDRAARRKRVAVMSRDNRRDALNGYGW